jgi:hypothetical protein
MSQRACPAVSFISTMCALFRLSRPMFWVGSELTKLQLERMHFASGPCPSSLSVSVLGLFTHWGPIYKQLTTCHEQAHAGHEKKEVFVCRRPLQQFEINGNYVYVCAEDVHELLCCAVYGRFI